MARSENQKLKLLYLRDYLLENTDENHSVKTSDIINGLQKIYNIAVERKTVYTDIDTLEDYGMEIDRDNGNYKILSRDFELYELRQQRRLAKMMKRTNGYGETGLQRVSAADEFQRVHPTIID